MEGCMWRKQRLRASKNSNVFSAAKRQVLDYPANRLGFRRWVELMNWADSESRSVGGVTTMKGTGDGEGRWRRGEWTPRGDWGP